MRRPIALLWITLLWIALLLIATAVTGEKVSLRTSSLPCSQKAVGEAIGA